jgi:glycosyltransferase involved in cell wall biosynthesis
MAHADTKPGLVSIIIPCFNYGHFLTDALSSVRVQSFENLECLIVDDGYTDNTAEIATDFTSIDSRFSHVSQKNQGLSAARNTGLARSRPEFVQFLDSDDLITIDKLQNQVYFLNENRDVDITYGAAEYLCFAKQSWP